MGNDGSGTSWVVVVLQDSHCKNSACPRRNRGEVDGNLPEDPRAHYFCDYQELAFVLHCLVEVEHRYLFHQVQTVHRTGPACYDTGVGRLLLQVPRVGHSIHLQRITAWTGLSDQYQLLLLLQWRVVQVHMKNHWVARSVDGLLLSSAVM
jgi:hypothetical protein